MKITMAYTIFLKKWNNKKNVKKWLKSDKKSQKFQIHNNISIVKNGLITENKSGGFGIGGGVWYRTGGGTHKGNFIAGAQIR